MSENGALWYKVSDISYIQAEVFENKHGFVFISENICSPLVRLHRPLGSANTLCYGNKTIWKTLILT